MERTRDSSGDDGWFLTVLRDLAREHGAVVMSTVVVKPDGSTAEYTRIHDEEFFFKHTIGNRDMQEFYSTDMWAAYTRLLDEDIRRHTKEQEREAVE